MDAGEEVSQQDARIVVQQDAKTPVFCSLCTRRWQEAAVKRRHALGTCRTFLLVLQCPARLKLKLNNTSTLEVILKTLFVASTRAPRGTLLPNFEGRFLGYIKGDVFK